MKKPSSGVLIGTSVFVLTIAAFARIPLRLLRSADELPVAAGQQGEHGEAKEGVSHDSLVRGGSDPR